MRGAGIGPPPYPRNSAVLAARARFLLTFGPMNLRQAAAAAFLLAAAAGRAGGLELHAERSSPFDLALKGRISGVPAGGERYARWSDLRALPTATLQLPGEFVRGPQALTVVFLSDLMAALPLGAGADCLLATCGDGYAGIFTSGFISRYRPFLVLEINGRGPADWPPPGLAYNPAPYGITVSASLAPEAAAFLDIEHKKPWNVATIEVADFSERFAGIYSGKFAAMGPAAQAGREIWLNSCASCHAGPAGAFGGTKADRPFQVIAAYAVFDRAFFMKYVRDPKSLVASAKMEAHPHYTDAQLSDLIEFIAAGRE
jgi:mono/diheme cytochrome c family protein